MMTSQDDGAAPLFTLRLPVRFTHTDPAGYVFFPRYFEMLQAVVEEWFTHALQQRYADLINKRRLGTPTATTQCTFLKPSRLGDEIALAVKLEHIGNSSFRLRFIGTVEGNLRLEAVSTLVMISLDDGAPRPIPQDLRARMEAYQAGK
ncbi:MAG: thioesterase family protein [Pseudorhodoplanes sp.]|jgi:4-hydroxybenzoyl-CoA thioesterase|nr:thioesterase family protein [Pseudorhodoplanes sp.]